MDVMMLSDVAYVADLRFDDTPFVERVPSDWLGETFNEVRFRMVHPQQFCPGSLVGTWRPATSRLAGLARQVEVVPRFMPCLEWTGTGQLCAKHASVGPVPPPPPIIWFPRPIPSPIPSPTPSLASVAFESYEAPPIERRRCRDCNDILTSSRVRCLRCLQVHVQAARDRREKREKREKREREAREAFERRKAVEPVYRCVVCDTRLAQPVSACQRCLDADRYRDQPEETVVGWRHEMGDWAHVIFHTNNRGESVVRGRVLPHKRYGESRTDAFGDGFDPD